MIFIQLRDQLQSLAKLLTTLSDDCFTKKIAHLGNASIGGHTRHVIELLQCAVEGYSLGMVDYVNRKRDLNLEIDKSFAQQSLLHLCECINKIDQPLKLVTESASSNEEVFTTYYREVVYNAEHTIHHLALIKVALIEMKLDIVNADFGMAYSTIAYRAKITTEYA
jgi:hypothetical protein